MVLYIKIFKKNIRLVLINNSGHTMFTTSTRAFDYQSRLRKSEDAITKLLWYFFKTLPSFSLQKTPRGRNPSLIIKFQGVGWKSNFRLVKIFVLALQKFFTITQMVYLTPVPFNGSKVKKKRR